MKSFLFWQKWLVVVSILIATFGVTMSLLNGTSFFQPFNDQINPVFWSGEDLPDRADRFQRWVYGAWGATVAGWGIFALFIARYPFRARQIWARNCLLFGLGVWYLLDTGISLFFRVTFNAFFNTLLLTLIAVPLAFTWRSFHLNGTNSPEGGV